MIFLVFKLKQARYVFAELSKLRPAVKHVSRLVLHFWPGFLSVVVMFIIQAVFKIFMSNVLSNLVFNLDIFRTNPFVIWSKVALIVLLVFILHSGYRSVLYFYYIKTEKQMYSKASVEALDQVLHKDQDYFHSYSPGLLSNRVHELAEGAAECFSIIQRDILPNIISVLVISVCLIKYSWILALNTLMPLIVSFLAVFLSLQKLAVSQAGYYEALSAFSGRLVDVLSNSVCVKLFCRHKYEKVRLEKEYETAIQYNAKANWQYMYMYWMYDLVIITMILVQFWVLLEKFKIGSVNGEQFLSIINQNFMLQGTLWQLIYGLPTSIWYLIKVQTALNVFKSGKSDALGLTELTVTGGAIEYSGVCFGYPSAATKLFRNLSLSISPGEKIALVGHSGSGKTTFINLLLGICKVESGSIKIDGQDINKVTVDSLRKNISTVYQKSLLFDRDIYENIIYGDPNATKEDLHQAIVDARLESVIKRSAAGIRTPVSQLSGGEKQRVAIARAMLVRSKILIFDEATSNLDTMSETKIHKAIDKVSQGKTTILITHRLSNLHNMDRILFFKSGEIVESGNHTELISLNGEYAALYRAGQVSSTSEVE